VAANAVERFDPEGRNSPEGEWRPREQPLEPRGSAATGLTRRSRRLPGRTGSGDGAEIRTGSATKRLGREVAGWER
jgi:hypothetical protein